MSSQESDQNPFTQHNESPKVEIISADALSTQLSAVAGGNLVNQSTGLGVPGIDPDTAVHPTRKRSWNKPRDYFEAMVESYWPCESMVSAPVEGPESMWGCVTNMPGDFLAECNLFFDCFADGFGEAQRLARTVGRAYRIRNVDDGRLPSEPIDMDNIKSVSYEDWILDGWQIVPAYTYENEYRLHPEYWQLVYGNYIDGLEYGLIIHRDRLEIFSSGVYQTPTSLYESNFRGISVNDKFWEHAARYGATIGNASKALRTFEIAIAKLRGLGQKQNDQSSAAEAQKKFRESMTSIWRIMSAHGLLFLDSATDQKGDPYQSMEFLSRRYTGAAEIMDRIYLDMIRASRFPESEFTGQEDKSKITNFSAQLLGEQMRYKRRSNKWWGKTLRGDPTLINVEGNKYPGILELEMRSENGPTGGEYIDEYGWQWGGDIELTPSEKAKVFDSYSTSYLNLKREDVVSSGEIRSALAGNGIIGTIPLDENYTPDDEPDDEKNRTTDRASALSRMLGVSRDKALSMTINDFSKED